MPSSVRSRRAVDQPDIRTFSAIRFSPIRALAVSANTDIEKFNASQSDYKVVASHKGNDEEKEIVQAEETAIN